MDNNTGQSSSPASLSSIDMMAYASPVIATYFLYGPTFNILPALYSKYFGLELTVIASILLFSRLFDAITDPLIGYLSDRHRRAGGSRKGWVITGGLLLIVSTWFLFVPPPNPSPGYYLLASFAFFLSFTLLEIPHVAWGGELSQDYSERSAVYSVRAAAVFIGFIGWSGFPLLPLSSSQEFTPEVLQDIVLFCLPVMLLALLGCYYYAPRGSIAEAPSQPDSCQQLLTSVIQNKPLLLLIIAYAIFSLGIFFWQGLLFIYLDSYMGLGANFALMQLSSNALGFMAIPLWKKLAMTSDKSTIMLTGVLVFIVAVSSFLLFKPGDHWLLVLFAMAIVHASFTCMAMIVPSMLSDTVDYGVLKFYHHRGGTYYSLMVFIGKVAAGLGVAMGLGIVGYFGLDTTASEQSEAAVNGLILAFVLLPVGLASIAAVLSLYMPINRHRYQIICKRIASRNTLPTV